MYRILMCDARITLSGRVVVRIYYLRETGQCCPGREWVLESGDASLYGTEDAVQGLMAQIARQSPDVQPWSERLDD